MKERGRDRGDGEMREIREGGRRGEGDDPSKCTPTPSIDRQIYFILL